MSKVQSLIDKMYPSQAVFLLFYGIFWGIVLNSVTRYRLFESHRLASESKVGRRYPFRRLFIGLIIIDVIPICWFLLLYFIFIEHGSEWVDIMKSAFASFSVFGFHRILHAFIATDKNWSKFYSTKEWEEVSKDYRERWKPNTFCAHFNLGVFYLIVIPFVGYYISYFIIKFSIYIFLKYFCNL